MYQETSVSGFNFDNTYARQMDGFYVLSAGDQVPAPQLIKLNTLLADEMGIDLAALSDDKISGILAGNIIPHGANPLAQVYAGHQFGHFSPQLGDGRALLLGEVVDETGTRRDIQLKGSGPTPFSRGGDGKAALGPVLREYITSEAMHALNIPTTRALGAVTTGETVRRETPLPGAVLTRVAASHLRVGTFEFFAARGETGKVRQLADYAIDRHFPELTGTDNRYLGLLRSVRDRQAETLAKWMLVGFVHGVMNTDNMTISGETIDFGPCAFIDTYDPAAVFSSIDAQGRYSYGNQPLMARWNIARFSETLIPLIDSDNEKASAAAMDEVNAFAHHYLEFWLRGMRLKLGLFTQEDDDIDLINELYTAMNGQNVDFTQFFRALSKTDTGQMDVLRNFFEDSGKFDQWHVKWQERATREAIPTDVRVSAMNRVNPIYIPRNHRVEEALAAAVQDADFSRFERLLNVLSKPFDERQGLDDYAQPAPGGFGPYKTFCGT
jgi:uncharacterized protein YdiU (UPF0061 family)